MPDKTPWGPDSPGYPTCPVPPGTDCTVYFRDEDNERDIEPEGWLGREWGRSPCGPEFDIIAYEPHSAPDQARELLAELATKWRDRQADEFLARIDAYLKGAL